MTIEYEKDGDALIKRTTVETVEEQSYTRKYIDTRRAEVLKNIEIFQAEIDKYQAELDELDAIKIQMDSHNIPLSNISNADSAKITTK